MIVTINKQVHSPENNLTRRSTCAPIARSFDDPFSFCSSSASVNRAARCNRSRFSSEAMIISFALHFEETRSRRAPTAGFGHGRRIERELRGSWDVRETGGRKSKRVYQVTS